MADSTAKSRSATTARATESGESTSQPARRETEDTRTRMLEAAGRVFAARGFDGATVREICSEAQVNVASVGYHFGDKMGLYREVIEGVCAARQRRFPAPNNVDGDPNQMLYRLVHTLLSRMLTSDTTVWEHQLMMREMNNPTPVFGRVMREVFRPMFDSLVHTIERLIGRPTSKQTLEQLAFSVVGQCLLYRAGSAMVQILIPETEREEHYDVDSLSRHITSVTLAAIENGAVINKRSNLDRLLAEAGSESASKPHSA